MFFLGNLETTGEEKGYWHPSISLNEIQLLINLNIGKHAMNRLKIPDQPINTTIAQDIFSIIISCA